MRSPILLVSSLYALIYGTAIGSLAGAATHTVPVRYNNTWESIDARPLPEWYDQAKFGIFMHWGVYSVPSFGSEWFWWHWQGIKPDTSYVTFMKDNYAPRFTYADFAKEFTTEFYDPNEFARTVLASGARYVVLTSKHHEGYTLYPSAYSWNWNSVDVGPKRDLVGDLRKAFTEVAPHIHFGLYFSQYEWFNRLYMKDRAAGFLTQDYPKSTSLPQMREIIEMYKPDVLWSDGDWEAPYMYWNSTDFLAWLYNDSPVKNTVVTNDRWGAGMACKHGGYYTCQDRYDPGVLQKHKWENCMTVDQKSWGFRRDMNIADVLSVKQLITSLARTVSCGGNVLLNVGPTHYGKIAPIFQERLQSIGHWLNINGEAIYHTKPWIYQNDTKNGDVWYTSRMSNATALNLSPARMYNPQISDKTEVYAILLKWPTKGTLRLGAPKGTATTRAHLMGHNHHLPVSRTPEGLKIDLSVIDWTELHSTDAWVIRLQHLDNDNRNPIEELKKMSKQ